MLRGRKRLFIEHYLGDCGGVATEAALAAGCGAGAAVTACRWLREPEVQKEIEGRLAQLGVTRERILRRLVEHAFGDVAELLEVTTGGVVSLRTEVVVGRPRGRGRAGRVRRLVGPTHLIRSVSFSRAHGVRLEVQDQQRALMLLGRYLRLWAGKELPEEGTSIDELAARIMGSAAERGG